ncbi:hypothetical protein Bca52824_043024 [Brassica carinata]|uniref:Uncharacterized protein n=1 Tax=Brassica carinata TaxID=52824 RepID=A0A8X7UXX8_BRACI|nr:hypothetical protein Bca52824_043024 [Brassica carinata]
MAVLYPAAPSLIGFAALRLRAKWLRFLVGDATLGSRCAIASSQSSGELQRSVEIGRVVAWTGRLWPAQ